MTRRQLYYDNFRNAESLIPLLSCKCVAYDVAYISQFRIKPDQLHRSLGLLKLNSSTFCVSRYCTRFSDPRSFSKMPEEKKSKASTKKRRCQVSHSDTARFKILFLIILLRMPINNSSYLEVTVPTLGDLNGLSSENSAYCIRERCCLWNHCIKKRLI